MRRGRGVSLGICPGNHVDDSTGPCWSNGGLSCDLKWDKTARSRGHNRTSSMSPKQTTRVRKLSTKSLPVAGKLSHSSTVSNIGPPTCTSTRSKRAIWMRRRIEPVICIIRHLARRRKQSGVRSRASQSWMLLWSTAARLSRASSFGGTRTIQKREILTCQSPLFLGMAPRCGSH